MKIYFLFIAVALVIALPMSVDCAPQGRQPRAAASADPQSALANPAAAMFDAIKTAAAQVIAEKTAAAQAIAQKTAAAKTAAAQAFAEKFDATKTAAAQAIAGKVEATKTGAAQAIAEKTAAAKTAAAQAFAEKTAAAQAIAEKVDATKTAAAQAIAEKVDATKTAAAQTMAEKTAAAKTAAAQAFAEKAAAAQVIAEKTAATKAAIAKGIAEKAAAAKANIAKAKAAKAAAKKTVTGKVNATKTAFLQTVAQRADALKAAVPALMKVDLVPIVAMPETLKTLAANSFPNADNGPGTLLNGLAGAGVANPVDSIVKGMSVASAPVTSVLQNIGVPSDGTVPIGNAMGIGAPNLMTGIKESIGSQVSVVGSNIGTLFNNPATQGVNSLLATVGAGSVSADMGTVGKLPSIAIPDPISGIKGAFASQVAAGGFNFGSWFGK